MQQISIAFALGLAGIDPLGVLLLAAARAGGMGRRPITLFGVTVLVGTILFGVGATLLLGGQAQNIANWLNNAPNEMYLILQSLVIGALFAWGVRRIIKLHQAKPTAKSESKLVKFLRFGAVPVGLLFALSMAADPTFLALIPVSAHHGSIILTTLVFTVWILVSQLPLFAFIIATHLGADKKMVAWLQKFQKRYEKRIGIAITVCILLAAAILCGDMFWFLTTGEWLF